MLKPGRMIHMAEMLKSLGIVCQRRRQRGELERHGTKGTFLCMRGPDS